MRQGDPGGSVKGLSSEQRGLWNDFLLFVKRKGVMGDKQLDLRNKDMGKQLMDEFDLEQAAAGKQGLWHTAVSDVQGEFNYFKEHVVFPGVSAGLGMNMAKMAMEGRQFSPVDDWFGSLTSEEMYPVAISPEGKDYGVDYATFDKDMEAKGFR